MSKLLTNTTSLQSLLEAVNNLPAMGTTSDLPELSSPAINSEVFANKEFIDGNGIKRTGTFTIESELNTQDNLISQIQIALEGKASGGTGSAVLQSKTVEPSTEKQVVMADNGYDGLKTVTVNAMQTATQATPSITINSNGLITATATQASGYVSSGTKSATKQLAFQAAKTITPTTADQIAVSSGYYTVGNITVKGDSNLVASNIKNGVSIFGVSGTLSTGGGGSTGNDLVEQLILGTITSYSNSTATQLRNYAFCDCVQLISLDFPNVTSIGTYGVGRCTKLASANFPAVTTIANNAFDYCAALTSMSFPVLTSIGGQAIGRCHKLESLDLPSAIYISANAFLTNRVMSCLTLGASTVCTLVNSNAFNSTPYAGYKTYFSGTPWIYVPSSLITSYQSATNWAYFSSYFSSIESLNEQA